MLVKLIFILVWLNLKIDQTNFNCPRPIMTRLQKIKLKVPIPNPNLSGSEMGQWAVP